MSPASLAQVNLAQVDLHFHAGLERQPGKSLADYLQYAHDSGRRWVGITDHVEMYTAPDAGRDNHRPYPLGQAGLRALLAEIEALRPRFPGLRLFFAPEYYTVYSSSGRHLFPLEDAPPWLFELADYLIYDSGLHELPGPPERTAALVQAIHTVGELAARFGKPGFIAHPLRSTASLDNSWRAFTPAVLALAEQAARQPDLALLNRLCEVDLLAVARASASCGVPLELNGMTQYHARRAGPPVYQAYVEAYRLMAAEGARFVTGSDQHKLSDHLNASGWWQPVAVLGLECLDQRFYQRLGISF